MNRDQTFYLDKIIDEVYAQLDQSTLAMIKDMDSDDSELRRKIDDAIAPEIRTRLQEIGLASKITLEQVGGFRMKSMIEESLNSDDPVLREAAQAILDTEDDLFNPEKQGMKVKSQGKKTPSEETLSEIRNYQPSHSRDNGSPSHRKHNLAI